MATVEYHRARDAQRALIHFANLQMQGRAISMKLAKEAREVPEQLSELGRPRPEAECQEICISSYNINPFDECALFVANLPFEIQAFEIKDLFKWIADVGKVVLLTEGGIKNGKSKGVAVVRCSTGIDAIQCINVFHEAVWHSRHIKVRLDKESMNGGAMQAQPAMAYQPVYQQPPPQQQQPNQGYYSQPMPVQNTGYTPAYQQPAQPAMPQPSYPQQTYSNPAPSFAPKQENTSSVYRANNAFTPAPVKQEPPKDDSETVKQLAAVLGIDAAALQQLRNQNQNNQNNRTRERSPVRQVNSHQPAVNNSPYRHQTAPPQQQHGGYKPNGQVNVNANIQSQNQQPAQPQQNTSWKPCTEDTIYISNIPRSMTESRLRSMMGTCGQIKFIDFPMQPGTNVPVGYAYVRFANEHTKSINRAVGSFDNFEIDGHKIVVGQY